MNLLQKIRMKSGKYSSLIIINILFLPIIPYIIGCVTNHNDKMRIAEVDVRKKTKVQSIGELNELRKSVAEYKPLYDTPVVAIFRNSLKEGSPQAMNNAGISMFGYASREDFFSYFKVLDLFSDKTIGKYYSMN